MEVAHRIWDRLHAVPPLVYDGLWAVLLCVVAAAELHFYRTGVATASPSLRSMAVVLLFTLPLAVRRRHPTICFGSQVAGSFLIPAQPPFTAIFALLLGTYSLLCLWTSTLAGAGLDTDRFGSVTSLPTHREDASPPSVQMLLGGMVAWLGGQATRQR
jgi:hypothetical protein